MYCNNCGKLIPDDANFCNHCGAKAAPAQYRQGTSAPQRSSAPRASTPPRTTAAPQKTATSRPSQSNEPPKVTAENSILAANAAKEKKGGLGGIFLVVLVFIVCYCLGNGVVAEFLSPGSSSSSGTIAIIPAATTPSIGTLGYPSSTSGLSFDDMMPDVADRLVTSSTFGSLEYAAYVDEYENGSLMLLEYGYEDDMIKRIENTLIIPTHGWDSATIGSALMETDTIIDELHQTNSSFTGTASVLGDYEYIYVEVCVTNLHLPSTLEAAIDEELLMAPEGTTAASMYSMDLEMKNQGFARK